DRLIEISGPGFERVRQKVRLESGTAERSPLDVGDRRSGFFTRPARKSNSSRSTSRYFPGCLRYPFSLPSGPWSLDGSIQQTSNGTFAWRRIARRSAYFK